MRTGNLADILNSIQDIKEKLRNRFHKIILSKFA